MAQISQLILFGILLLCYLKIHGAGIAYAGALAVSLVAFARYSSAWEKLSIPITSFGIFLLLHSALSGIALTPNYGFGKEQAKQLVYAMTNFTILSTVLMLGIYGDPDRRPVVVQYVLIAMLVIAFLEVYGPIKPLIDAIRQLYTSATSIYEATERDIQQYGAVRPTVFTSEPSSLGNFYGVLWAYVILSVRNRPLHVAVNIALMGIAVFLIRSPTLLGYAVIVPGLALVLARRPILGYTYLVAVLAFVLIVPGTLWVQRDYVQNPSLNEFLSTGSYFIRQIAPLISVDKALSASPLFGAAFNYYEVARDSTYSLLSFFHGGFYDAGFLTIMPAGQYVTNAAWEFVGVYGAVGGVTFVVILLRLLKTLNIQHGPALLLATASLWTSHAGITLAFTWTPLMVLSLAFYAPRARVSRFQRPSAPAPIVTCSP